jgi:hypothetical protein
MAIQIGCDPEFLLIKGNTRIDSSVNKVTANGGIGSDHNGRVGELRPKHGHPKNVTENICSLIRILKSDLELQRENNVKMIGGGGGGTAYMSRSFSESIGGHIHISGLNFDYNQIHYNKQFSSTCSKEDKLILALDFFIGRRMTRIPGGKRASSNYGKPADVRQQDWGFEYRTPPSWLCEPKLTESTLALAYLIAQIWSENPTIFDELLSQRVMARKMDYVTLTSITRNNAENEYFTTQINNFKKIIFDKTYNMSEINCFDSWLTTILSNATETTSIELKLCQIKIVNYQDSLESEMVLKICQFVTNEVKVYVCNGIYAPYYMRRTRTSRLRTDTIYISRELRPYLKIKREVGIHVRFINFISDDRLPIANAFMFTKQNMKSDLQSVVEIIINNCVRKKLKK